jgi:glycosyltransferase involved in cell wall biosynthesis
MVTGLHDRRWLDNVVANYALQTHANKRLIIVENGKGLGYAADCVGLPGVVVLQSEPGPAQPLNVALEWMRANASPYDWFCKCDADDYYGPKYLESLRPAIESGADYAGRSSLYIRTTEGRLWYVEWESYGHLFHGPTLTARVSSALDFPVVKDWGEDEGWCQAMHRAGRLPFTVPPEGFCYQRWADYEHTWPCADYEIRTSWNSPFVDLGIFDAEIVNGTKSRPIGLNLGIAELTADTFMPFRILTRAGSRP